MKRYLLALGEREVRATQGRILHLARMLVGAGHAVDVGTCSESVQRQAQEFFRGAERVRVIHVASKRIPVSMAFRDNLVRFYIEHVGDLQLPGAGLPLWKPTAFDDFRGHIAEYGFRLSDMSYDAVLLPMGSMDEPPTENSDIFYSTVIFRAREEGVPVFGLQLYPVFSTPVLMTRMVDGLLVKDAGEKDYYASLRIEPGRIRVLTDPASVYALDTIENVYLETLLHSDYRPPPDHLSCLLINHARYRPQVRATLETLAALDRPVTVYFLKRGYDVRELTEDDVVSTLFSGIFRRPGLKVHIAEEGTLVQLILISDIVVSPTYLIPLRFAVENEKLAVVFQPGHAGRDGAAGVHWVSDTDGLRRLIEGHDRRKVPALGIVGALGEIREEVSA